MKRILFTASLALFALVGVASAGVEKVDICHFTGSEGNPLEVITISDSAYDAHIAHGDTDITADNPCDDGGGGDPDPT